MSWKSALLTPFAVRQGQRLLGDLPELPLPSGAPHGLARPVDAATDGSAPLTLVLLGDETAAGVGAKDGSEALPSVLAGLLAEAVGREVLWQTLGEQGASTLRVRGRQAAQLAPSAEVVVLLVGQHDLLARHTVEEWREELAGILRMLARVPQLVVCGCPQMAGLPVLRWPMSSTLDEQARSFDEVTRALCAEHRVAFVSLREEPSAAAPSKEHALGAATGDAGQDDDALADALVAPDGLHPGPAMQRRWAERIAAAVELPR